MQVKAAAEATPRGAWGPWGRAPDEALESALDKIWVCHTEMRHEPVLNTLKFERAGTVGWEKERNASCRNWRNDTFPQQLEVMTMVRVLTTTTDASDQLLDPSSVILWNPTRRVFV